MPRQSKKVQVQTRLPKPEGSDSGGQAQNNQNFENLQEEPASQEVAPVAETTVPGAGRPTSQGEAFVGGDVPTQEVSGFLEITHEGHGFLRPKFIASSDDVYISASQIRKFSLRPGDFVSGLGRAP